MPAEGLLHSTGRRAVAALLATALLVFAAVGGATYVVAHRIARADALAEALRTAQGMSRSVFLPELAAAARGDATAARDLDRAVATRRQDGSLERVKLWRRDGTVLWSDDTAQIGRTYPVGRTMLASFDRGVGHAGLSTLDDQDNGPERRLAAELVEVYVPVAVGGARLTMEMYFPDSRVRTAEDDLGEQIVPLALLALLVLALAQLPVSVWLIRRTTTAQKDRERMLGTMLVASERERRLVARHLHDGVVQELAGAAYLIDERLPTGAVPPEHRRLLGVLTHILHRAVADLRGLLVELHPRELSGDTLRELVVATAARACPEAEVEVTGDFDRPLPPGPAAFVFRCVRECVTNVAKHAHASRLWIDLRVRDDGLVLVVRDDGVGVPEPALSRSDGHIGLALLREAATDLGGSLRVGPGRTGGTAVTVAVPLGPAQD